MTARGIRGGLLPESGSGRAAWYRKYLDVDANADTFWRQAAGVTVFAPFPADSDYFAADQPFANTSRHRLNRHGDRRLSSAVKTVARVRLSYDPDTRASKQRRLAEGKTRREVKRMFKRCIARQIYRPPQ